MFFTTIQASWLLGFWFIFQLLSGIGSGSTQDGVAFWAHIGGFLAGMALIWPFREKGFKARLAHARGRARGRSRIPDTSRRQGPWS